MKCRNFFGSVNTKFLRALTSLSKDSIPDKFLSSKSLDLQCFSNCFRWIHCVFWGSFHASNSVQPIYNLKTICLNGFCLLFPSFTFYSCIQVCKSKTVHAFEGTLWLSHRTWFYFFSLISIFYPTELSKFYTKSLQATMLFKSMYLKQIFASGITVSHTYSTGGARICLETEGAVWVTKAYADICSKWCCSGVWWRCLYFHHFYAVFLIKTVSLLLRSEFFRKKILSANFTWKK